MKKKLQFQFRNKKMTMGSKTIVMGILNVTPDSFSENAENFFVKNAITSALSMINCGADIIDIGGESSRPGAEPVSAKEEIERTIPVIKRLRKLSNIPISIDTWKSSVAEEAIKNGADIINDISGFHRDENMKSIAARTNSGCIAMHMRGTSKTMQSKENLEYDDLIEEILTYFQKTVDMLIDCGIKPTSIVLDPGIGFSKTVKQNLLLLRNLSKIRELGFPILAGISRKSFIGQILDIKDPKERIWGTAGAAVCSSIFGADIQRVHDVKEISEALKISDAIITGV
ncbi:MAG: dihydropteroate synthase [Verrucomicrobiota bacterium]|nr:dihydropteroate synthase [Verrucomicrobiota bacterium]